MSNNKPVRLVDIAQVLSLSVSTVSRALDDKTASSLSPAVVGRVRKAAKSMNYIRNQAGSSLRRNQNPIVGMIVPDILNPVFTSMIKGAHELLSKTGRTLVVSYSENNPEIALEEVKRMLSINVSGLLIASAFLEDPSVLYCIKKSIATVLVYRSINQGYRLNQVLGDDWHGMELAIEHLKTLGHRKIVFFSGPANILQGRDRKEAFCKIAVLHGIEYNTIQSTGFTVEGGLACTKELLKSATQATAIIVGNDLMALGAIQALKQRGLQVPRDYSIIGFNNMPLLAYFTPALTTIAIPHWELGRTGAQMLIDELMGYYTKKRQMIKISPFLVNRESTAKPATKSSRTKMQAV